MELRRLGGNVAAIHAGWRGLANGIIANTINLLTQKHAINAADLLVWLGPAIGPDEFEVGQDVVEAFLKKDAQMQSGFKKISADKWLADIFSLARMDLNMSGIKRIYGGGVCTYNNANRFYSYRRDKITGRMVSMIWKS